MLEESNLIVKVGPLLFIKEFFEKTRGTYHLEQYYIIESYKGKISLNNITNTQNPIHFITDINWFTQQELQSMKVFPEQLKTLLWTKIKEVPITALHLGVEIQS